MRDGLTGSGRAAGKAKHRARLQGQPLQLHAYELDCSSSSSAMLPPNQPPRSEPRRCITSRPAPKTSHIRLTRGTFGFARWCSHNLSANRCARSCNLVVIQDVENDSRIGASNYRRSVMLALGHGRTQSVLTRRARGRHDWPIGFLLAEIILCSCRELAARTHIEPVIGRRLPPVVSARLDDDWSNCFRFSTSNHHPRFNWFVERATIDLLVIERTVALL